MKARVDPHEFRPRLGRSMVGQSGGVYAGYHRGRPASTRYFVEKYLADEGRNLLFDAYDVEPPTQVFIEMARHDPAQHLLLFSPASAQSLDLQVLTREVMTGLGEDHGQSPDYLAAIHRDTRIEHVHVVLRGRDQEGHTLHVSPAYVHGRLQERAEVIARRMQEVSREPERYRSIDLDVGHVLVPARERGRGWER
jgi:hypothetical protein